MVLTKCSTIFADNNLFIVRNNIITSTGKNQGCPILNYKVEQIRGFSPPPIIINPYSDIFTCCVLFFRPSSISRRCDRTNSREFNDSPRIQRDVAILTHHRNFPAPFLPSAATPRAEFLPCRHYQSSENGYTRHGY